MVANLAAIRAETKRRVEFAAHLLLDEDQEFIEVYQANGRWYVVFIDYNGWERRKEVTEF